MFVWNEGDLNPEQEAAIAEERNVFLVACPGSGKTRTLTYKIASQLSNVQSDKQWVVAITYTNRAADDIHERIENFLASTHQSSGLARSIHFVSNGYSSPTPSITSP